MNNNNYIMQELMEICPTVAKINKANVYSVSPFYFNDLSEVILSKIIFNKDRAYNLSSSTPFSVPENYFEDLAEKILLKMQTGYNEVSEVFEEMERIAPLLNTISKKQVYNIPPGFFDKVQMPPSIRIEGKKSKVVPINKWSKFLRFSAAAVITSFLAIGLYTITGKDFIFSRRNNSREEIKNLSKEEIVNFLRNNSSIENVTSASPGRSKNENAIKSSLKRISDQEIHQFLKETGESDEI